MPEPTEPQAPPAAPQPTAPVPAPPPSADEPLGEPGLRALQAERDARAEAERRATALAAQVAEFESQNQTELERAQTRAAQLETDLVTERAQRLRLQVANTHSISAADLVLLTGTTEEELTAQATRIAALNTQRAAATAAPAFAPAPGQQAGNGAPPPPAATVDAGRQLYQQKHAKSA
jgi:hypothetical protein